MATYSETQGIRVPRERWMPGDSVRELSTEPADRDLDRYRDEQDYGPDPYADVAVSRVEWDESCGPLPTVYDLIVDYEGGGSGSCTITLEEHRRRSR